MMPVLSEQNIRIDFKGALSALKFDDPSIHGLSHAMKAVDFIVEFRDKYLFVEIKDPDNPNARDRDVRRFLGRIRSGSIDAEFYTKLRDSFLYRWAEKKADKPIVYAILIASESLTDVELTAKTDDLRRKLPSKKYAPANWNRAFVEDCGVFTLESWNRNMKHTASRVAMAAPNS